MQTESVLQTKNRYEPAKNQFSVALVIIMKQFLFAFFVENFHVKKTHLIILYHKLLHKYNLFNTDLEVYTWWFQFKESQLCLLL